MTSLRWALLAVVALSFGVGSMTARAETSIQVAVAANFLSTAETLSQAYEKNTGVKIVLSAASTGKLYAQIRNGLPAEVFLAADAERPQLLVEEGLADGSSRWTYAIGELSFWAPGVSGDAAACEQWLRAASFSRLAIANPRTAPYGTAAREVLRALGLGSHLSGQVVQGENIAQAFLFIDTGAAEAGFVAHSQLIAKAQKQPEVPGCQWHPAAEQYPELRQDGVILNSARERDAVWQWVDWLQSAEAQRLIRAAGYRLP